MARFSRGRLVDPFRVVAADPPWKFGDKLPGGGRGAAKHYDVLSVEEIERYPLPPIADDALLFLWRVAAMVPEAIRVAKAWGFTPMSEMVWVKTTSSGELHFGMGRYVRASHETCIIATRGRAASLVIDHSIRSVFFAEVGEHSAKPDEFFHLVERLYPGPRVELFSRVPTRRDWTLYGREAPGNPEAPAASSKHGKAERDQGQ